jgi:nucleotide-binding universal stress UspA family protein
MKVFIAVDGSAGSFETVGQIGALLSTEKDEIALFCAPPQVRLKSFRPDPSVLARAQAGVAEAVFVETRKRLPEAIRARVQTITGTQDARHSISQAAEAWGADLVAVGARGLGMLERMLLGSVSRAVVHQSSAPVWVARPRPGATGRPLNVLLACENPELGRTAAQLLGRLAWPTDTHFAMLCVIQSIFAGRVPDWLEQQARGPDVEAMVQAWAKEHDEERRSCQANMEQFVATLPPTLSAAKVLVAEGEPAREILAAIQREHIDLVVVGSMHKRSMANIILGSTSEAVLNHAACSVLVVPHRGEA